ncbi:MAG: gamma-glutamyltransferase [Verrucomicrobia bacterium]|nr:gamma-glutamyltransferase [Verrucomicrobiota bacterium]
MLRPGCCRLQGDPRFRSGAIFPRPLARFIASLLLGFNLTVHGSPPEHAALATVHPIASRIAARVMQDGGNAVDAAVAAGFALGVVDGENSGIGGGCFLLIRTPRGKVIAIDGRETAPARAARDMFVRNGRVDPRLSQTGPLAVGTPGALAAYAYAAKHFGRLGLKKLLEAPAMVAEHGFPIQRTYAERLLEEVRAVEADPGSRQILLNGSGRPWATGEVLLQPDLAASYRSIANQGEAWFYRGPYSRAVGDWMSSHGGVLRGDDFSRYRVQLREPIRTTYRGYEILGFPPPSSGGVHVGQILNILESVDLRSKGRNSAEFMHWVTEAMKLAFADRAFWLGDPDFARVPRGLVSKRYAADLASRIRPDRSGVVAGHGVPENSDREWFGKHTTHFSTADALGNWVACTATINTTFGAKVIVPGTGIVLNNEMDDFAAAAGVTNFFGLVGGDANAVAPGKRPLSSMSPTLVLRDGKPVLSVGAAGGPTIISQTLLAILGVVDFQMSVEATLAAPRFHHQWRPDELLIERSAGSDVIAKLRALGHSVRELDSLGACQAVGLHPDGRFAAAHDPRVEGKAVSW